VKGDIFYEQEGQLFLEEKEKLKDDPEFLPSKEAVQKFSQLLDVHLKKPKAYARRQHILKVLNRVAVAMLIIFVILCTTVVTVQAVRVRVLNYLTRIRHVKTLQKKYLKNVQYLAGTGKFMSNITL
jgi:hypothetical protein